MMQLKSLHFFQEIVSKGGTGHHREALTEDEFIELFGVLTDLPEYKSALRLATPDGNDQMDAAALQKFLSEEQQARFQHKNTQDNKN